MKIDMNLGEVIMKPVRMIPLLVLVLVVGQLLAGCSDVPSIDIEPSGKFTHFVDVYLTKEAHLGGLMNQAAGDHLWLYPGDVLIVNNTTDEEGSVTYPEGLCKFLGGESPTPEEGKVTVSIKPRGRVMLKVIKKVTDADAFDLRVGAIKTFAAPKVKVGDGP